MSENTARTPEWRENLGNLPTDRIQQIRDREAAATPGPWEFWSNVGVQCHDLFGRPTGDPLGPGHQGVKIGNGGNRTLTIEADSRFIAHARSDIPYLLAEVERLTDERDRLAHAARRFTMPTHAEDCGCASCEMRSALAALAGEEEG